MEITRWSGVISSKTPRTAFLFLGGGVLKWVFGGNLNGERLPGGKVGERERETIFSMMTCICLFVSLGGNKKLKTEQTKHFGEVRWSGGYYQDPVGGHLPPDVTPLMLAAVEVLKYCDRLNSSHQNPGRRTQRICWCLWEEILISEWIFWLRFAQGSMGQICSSIRANKKRKIVTLL